MNKKEHLIWFEKADDDEESIKILLKEGGPPSTACFLAQQMAEKYIKGLLIFHGVMAEKTHDLLKLSAEVQKFTPEILQATESLGTLNRYYIGGRYPGDFPVFSRKEAEQALDYAQHLKRISIRQTKA